MTSTERVLVRERVLVKYFSPIDKQNKRPRNEQSFTDRFDGLENIFNFDDLIDNDKYQTPPCYSMSRKNRDQRFHIMESVFEIPAKVK